MKKILIALLIIVLLNGCTATKEEDGIKKSEIIVEEDKIEENKIEENKIEYIKINVEEAKEMMDTEEVIILDVRTQEEYEVEHIEGALLIPDYDLKDLSNSKLPDKDEKILVYCRSGNRSKSAAKALIEMGYTNVYDFGGINSWPYGTVKGE